MQKVKRGVALTGGSIVILWLGFSAIIDKLGHVGAMTKLLPKRAQEFVRSPDGILFLLIIGVATLWWAIRNPHETRDAASLYEANARLRNDFERLRLENSQLAAAVRPRALSQTQRTTLVRTLTDRIAAFKNDLVANHGWSPEDLADAEPVGVQVIAMGTDPETLRYRDELVSAFNTARLTTAVADFTSGGKGYENFVDAVTILRDREENLVRPLVLEALSAAGIAYREDAWLPPRGTFVEHGPQLRHPAAILVVGQRG